MQADDLLRAGDIAGARASLADELRRNPGDTRARQFFWQLMALVGEWDKAEKQLRTLATTQPSAMMLATVYGQTLKAERLRAEVMAGRQKPTSLVGTEPWVIGLLDALDAHNRSEPGAQQLSEQALEAAPATPGTINGESFAWIADADLRFGPMMEVIVGETYGFIPFAAMARVTAAAPVDLRDTIWLPVEITLRSGQTSMAFAPALYPDTPGSSDPQCVLGRVTLWSDASGIEIGLGQRLLNTDSADYTLLELRDLKLDESSG